MLFDKCMYALTIGISFILNKGPPASLNDSSSKKLFLRPLYNGILSNKFKSKLPYVAIPLNKFIVPAKNGNTGIKKYWIEIEILPAIWNAVDELYRKYRVPLSESHFHQEYPSCDPDILQKPQDIIMFSAKAQQCSFKDLRSALETFCQTSEFADIKLDVLFPNQFASFFYQDLHKSTIMTDYLIIQDGQAV